MEKINKKDFLFIILILLFAFSFFILSKNNFLSFRTENFQNRITKIEIGGKILNLNVADNSFLREKGLSRKESIRKDEGLLFIFEKPSKNFFWMKEMNFSIDIIWIDENNSIIFIKKDAKPESYPESFGPNKNSKYVLETYAGFSEMNNLKEGDFVKFLP